MNKKLTKYTNSLINESSPYLLQHAHNPVQWYAWNEDTLALAKRENKPLLISIGYSACHWCHVMAHETFEDEDIARVMNESFICIKVDREERPDLDQIYMNAVQLMTSSGGWPLNCFALPDGKPFFGGTYFPPAKWLALCQAIAREYKNDPVKLSQYAAKVVLGIKQDDLIKNKSGTTAFTIQDIKAIVSDWRNDFDLINGGARHSPKFPMPNNQLFLLRFAFYAKDDSLLDYVRFTLNKMAMGGIYDHVGGGFARYSTDSLWKVPHFEKMLYDNAQLVSLYAEAFRITKDPLYSRVVKETLAFIQAQLTSPDGVFYSSLDADSEGEEGKYYTWTETELRKILGDKYEIAQQIFSINPDGYWEDGQYILLINNDLESIAKKIKVGIHELFIALDEIKLLLRDKRGQRIPPDTDDKVLTSWNALMIKAYADAYAAVGDPAYLDRANQAADFLMKNVSDGEGALIHSFNNARNPVNGFLDDYSFLIEALIALYQATFDEKWVWKAKAAADYVLKHFSDKNSGMFFYTSDMDPGLIVRKLEVTDNVIPSSNSGMAHNLFLLGHIFEDVHYLELSKIMLSTSISGMRRYPSGFSNWGLLLLQNLMPFYEVAICGSNSKNWGMDFQKPYIPNKTLAVSTEPINLPLLMKERFVQGKTLIYVCVNNTCQAPINSVDLAIKEIKRSF